MQQHATHSSERGFARRSGEAAALAAFDAWTRLDAETAKSTVGASSLVDDASAGARNNRAMLRDYLADVAAETTLNFRELGNAAATAAALDEERVAEAALDYALRFLRAEPHWDSRALWQIVALCALRAWTLYYVGTSFEDVFSHYHLLFMHKLDETAMRRRLLTECQLSMACAVAFPLGPSEHDLESCRRRPASAPVSTATVATETAPRLPPTTEKSCASELLAQECGELGKGNDDRVAKRRRIEAQ